MTREEVWKKRDECDDRLTPIEYAKANHYKSISFILLLISCASCLLVFAGTKTSAGYLIILGVFALAICLGLSIIFSAKEALIRKYLTGTSWGSLYNCTFGPAAITGAKIRLAFGYSLIAVVMIIAIVATLKFLLLRY